MSWLPSWLESYASHRPSRDSPCCSTVWLPTVTGRASESDTLPVSGTVTAVFFVAYVSFPLGYLLFGIATMRAGMLPRWGALLLAVGAVLLNFLVPVSVVLAAIGFAMFGAAFLWLGYALWSGTGETERQPEPST